MQQSFDGSRGDDMFNYVSGSGIFIITDITLSTTASIYGGINKLVQEIPVFKPVLNGGKIKIKNPYEISDARPVIDVFINSGGGNTRQYTTILGLLSIAKNRGAIIRTQVMGCAGSAASLLAINGTPGYRIMSERSEHFAHYGSGSMSISKSTEIEKAAEHIKNQRDISQKTYLRNTKINADELKILIADEMGYMSSQRCLELGFCDHILMDDGKIKSR